MKKVLLIALWAVLAVNLFMPQEILAAAVLQITGEPGISIWLDNDFMGKTTKEQNGLVITDLEPGEYILRASMPGYDTRDMPLTVEGSEKIDWRISLTKPSMVVEDIVRRVDSKLFKSGPRGIVTLQSIPLDAEIYFDGNSIGPADKKLSYVPAAEHEVRFVYQQKELSKKFSLQPGESVLLKADFMKSELVMESAEIITRDGPAVIKMQTSRKRKPAIFPHRKHQQMYDCANCHHGRDSNGKQTPYTEGMEIQHCATCHNPTMENKLLNSLMLAAHARCKGCHKKVVAESGTAGPIAKCSGCHKVDEDEETSR